MQDDLFAGDKIERRVFVKGIGFLSLAFVMGMFGGCEPIIDAIKNRPVRRRLRVGSPEVDADIATFASAVSLMRGLDPADKRHWNQIAGIHGTSASFNLCEHDTSEDSSDTNTIQFFTWHRAYLFSLERICQELTGNKKFGLPYWNWNQTSAVHPAFLDPSSPLFMTRARTSIPNFAAPQFSNQTMDIIFSDTNFFTFSLQLEGGAHNTVHSVIGGNTTLGSGASPLDPLFWAHHNMVDYCWAKWNLEMGNDNPNDPGWTGVSWDYFVDGSGVAGNTKAGLTTIMPLLSYRFESSTIGSHGPSPEAMSKAEFDQLEKRVREGADIRFDIRKRINIAERASLVGMKPFSSKLNVSSSDIATLINTNFEQEKVFASIHYATAPPTSDFFVRVFVDLPTADVNTPVEDPHYAGSFAFFGKHGEGSAHHNTGGPRFLVNVSPTLQRLKERQELVEGKPLSIQLVPVPVDEKLEGAGAEIVLEKVDLIVTPVIVKSR